MNKLEINEMHEMLADYTFGKLNQHEKQIFEYNLQYYPQIVAEIEATKQVFGSLDNLSIRNELDNRTRNMSIKVNATLAKKSLPNKWNYKTIFQYAIPTLAIIVMFVIYLDKPLGKESQLSQNSYLSKSIINLNELQAIFDDEFDYDNDLLSNTYDYFDISQSLYSSENYLQYNDLDLFIFDFDNSLPSSLSADDIELYIKDENEFQQLIKELENEL